MITMTDSYLSMRKKPPPVGALVRIGGVNKNHYYVVTRSDSRMDCERANRDPSHSAGMTDRGWFVLRERTTYGPGCWDWGQRIA